MKIKDLSNTKNKEIEHNRASITLRFTLIALILILSCYYLWVLYKAVTPNVSSAYKAYYIKTQTLFWQPNKPNLSLNIPSSLDVTKKSPYLSRKGWDKNADNGYRQLNSSGGLYFTLPFILKKNIKVTLTLASPLTSPVHFSMNKWQGVFTPQKRANIVEAEIPIVAFKTNHALQFLQFNTSTPLLLKNVKISFTTLNAISHKKSIPLIQTSS